MGKGSLSLGRTVPGRLCVGAGLKAQYAFEYPLHCFEHCLYLIKVRGGIACLLARNSLKMMLGSKTFLEGIKQVGKSFSNEKWSRVGHFSFPVCRGEANAISTAIQEVQVVVGLRAVASAVSMS